MKSDDYNKGKIVRMVDMYFDNALNNEEQQNLFKNIENNPVYSELYRKEKQFRTFIKDNVTRPEVSQEFKDSIKHFIHRH